MKSRAARRTTNRRKVKTMKSWRNPMVLKQDRWPIGMQRLIWIKQLHAAMVSLCGEAVS